MTSAVITGDHHVHSTFSDDAISTIAENVAAAAAADLSTLCLVDHVRRDTAWVPQFLAAVRALEVPEGLDVLTGVEAKILDASGELDLPPLPEGIDRILIADHQFPTADGPLGPSAVRARMEEGWSVEEVLDTLVNALIAAMRRHPGNQLAHCFSIIPKIGLTEEQLGTKRLRAWAQAAAETGTLVEVNEKWACPGPVALRALLEAGAGIVASTDSHRSGDVGRYDRIRGILKEAGL